MIIVVDRDMTVRNGTPGSGHLFQLMAGKPLPMESLQEQGDRRRLEAAIRSAIQSGVSTSEIPTFIADFGWRTSDFLTTRAFLIRVRKSATGSVMDIYRSPVTVKRAPAYQDALRTPGISAFDARVRKQIRHIRNLR